MTAAIACSRIRASLQVSPAAASIFSLFFLLEAEPGSDEAALLAVDDNDDDGAGGGERGGGLAEPEDFAAILGEKHAREFPMVSEDGESEVAAPRLRCFRMCMRRHKERTKGRLEERENSFFIIFFFRKEK